MTIAITGASGQLGQHVIEALTNRTSVDNIVALARTPEKIASLGVKARAFDYGQVDTLPAALEGVDTLILISSSEIGQRIVQHRNVIKAAKSSGVKHILYTSLLHADQSILSLAPEHRATEEEIKASGLTYTILRNGWYTENYTASIAPALKGGAFIGSAGTGLISSATRADYAEALAVVATSGRHEGKTYELAGDTAWTLADLAAEISRQTGTALPYYNLPESEYAAVLLKAGLPEGLAHGLASWDVAASEGALFDDSGALSALIGRPTTSLAKAVAQVL